jgi:hypothetical protein
VNTCVICSASFVPGRHSTGKYCSRHCAWEGRGGAAYNARIARESAEKRGDMQRHTGILLHTYIKRMSRHEHRVVAEEKLGRQLNRREIVHHIDGNPKNNDSDNLMVITQREHMLEHGLGVPGETPKHKPWLNRRHSENDPNSTLSNADVLRMREMALFGAKQKDIGSVFGHKQPYISQIISRHRWGHV